MILGKTLIDNGQAHDAKGFPIDPNGPYEADANGFYHRAGLVPAKPQLPTLFGPGMLAGLPEVEPTDVREDHRQEEPPDGDTM